METVKSEEEARSWFLIHSEGFVIVERSDGATKEVSSYPEAMEFLRSDGPSDFQKEVARNAVGAPRGYPQDDVPSTEQNGQNAAAGKSSKNPDADDTPQGECPPIIPNELKREYVIQLEKERDEEETDE